MARDLKFRVWGQFNKEIGEMIYVDLLTFPDGSIGFRTNHRKSTIGMANPIIMQYIGLKDNTGKEIYEGDILQQFNHDGDSSGKYFINTELSGCCSDTYGWEIEDPDNEIIIGNIYENPELLED